MLARLCPLLLYLLITLRRLCFNPMPVCVIRIEPASATFPHPPYFSPSSWCLAHLFPPPPCLAQLEQSPPLLRRHPDRGSNCRHHRPQSLHVGLRLPFCNEPKASGPKGHHTSVSSVRSSSCHAADFCCSSPGSPSRPTRIRAAVSTSIASHIERQHRSKHLLSISYLPLARCHQLPPPTLR